jgi:hypothetical protein
MNFRVIIHALILLFILHIIIINIDYEINIGNTKESFINPLKNKTEDNSLDFLLESKEKDNEFINRMNEISNSLENPPKKSEFQEKNEHTVLPGNNYLNQENTPNFESNVLDTSKLYKIQNNYDSLNENQLQSTSLEDLNKKTNNIITEVTKIDNQVRQAEEKPNVWEYNNEFAMNGGPMNGIVGFDGLESQYSNFGSVFDVKKNDNPEYNEIPHDDLRKPVVVN